MVKDIRCVNNFVISENFCIFDSLWDKKSQKKFDFRYFSRFLTGYFSISIKDTEIFTDDKIVDTTYIFHHEFLQIF